MEEILNKLIEIVRQTAPELWKIAIRQSYVNAGRDIIIALVLFIVAMIALRAHNNVITIYNNQWEGLKREPRKKYINEADVFEEKAGYAISSITFGLGFIIFFISGLMKLGNPEYYAIKVLMELISK